MADVFTFDPPTGQNAGQSAGQDAGPTTDAATDLAADVAGLDEDPAPLLRLGAIVDRYARARHAIQIENLQAYDAACRGIIDRDDARRVGEILDRRLAACEAALEEEWRACEEANGAAWSRRAAAERTEWRQRYGIATGEVVDLAAARDDDDDHTTDHSGDDPAADHGDET